jgi:hypothetical protein
MAETFPVSEKVLETTQEDGQCPKQPELAFTRMDRLFS